jgi:hypothetical protein
MSLDPQPIIVNHQSAINPYNLTVMDVELQGLTGMAPTLDQCLRGLKNEKAEDLDPGRDCRDEPGVEER